MKRRTEPDYEEARRRAFAAAIHHLQLREAAASCALDGDTITFGEEGNAVFMARFDAWFQQVHGGRK